MELSSPKPKKPVGDFPILKTKTIHSEIISYNIFEKKYSPHLEITADQAIK